MKAGIIDIFVDSFAWVFGKAFLFAAAVLSGVAIGGLSLWAGSMVGNGDFTFLSAGSHPVHGQILVIALILPQFAALFLAGMWFVRSENTKIREWGLLAGGQAWLLMAFFCGGLDGGLLSQLVGWSVLMVQTSILVGSLILLQKTRQRRGEDHLQQVLAANQLRREDLKQRFGTHSAGIGELEIE